MEKKMFYGASAWTFEKAKELRFNMTEAEEILWKYLGTNPMGYKFRRQHPFFNYIADFFCYKLKLVIEIDGSIHNEEEVIIIDKERQAFIESEGIRVIRFTNDEVIYQLGIVLEKIKTLLHD
jgi:cyclase